MIVLDMLDAQSRMLAEQNKALESVDLALLQHKEQVLRQNELPHACSIAGDTGDEATIRPRC